MRLAILLVAMSGCIWGMCGPTVSEVTWQSTSMFDALDGPVTGPEGFDIGQEHVAAKRIIRAEEGRDSFGIDATGLRGYADGHDGPKRAEVAARQILENVTDLAADAIEAAAQAFAGSAQQTGEEHHEGRKEPWYVFEYAIEADVHLDALLAAHPGLTWEHAEPRGFIAYAEADGWIIDYSAASRTWTDGTVAIQADALGIVEATGPWRENEPESAVLADLRQRIDDAGLPVPEEMEAQVVVC